MGELECALRRSPTNGEGPLPSPKGIQLPDAVKEQVLSVLSTLKEETRDDAALGDAATQTRNIAVSEAAASLRSSISKTRDCARFAVENDGIEAVVLALQRRPNSEAVQAKATGALGQLVLHCSQWQAIASNAGAVEVVIASILGHPNSEPVQASALEALSRLLENGLETNQTLAYEAGGVEAVILALDHHTEGNHQLSKNAVAALRGLVINNAQGQARVLRCGGMPALERTMQRHLGVDAFEEVACEALAAFVARNKECQRVACETNVVATVINVLKRHRTCKGVVIKALSALSFLVVENPEGQKLSADAGGAEAVLGALKAFPNQDGVLQFACQALGNLVSNNLENQNTSREIGLLKVIIQNVLSKSSVTAVVLGLGLEAVGRMVAGNAESQRSCGEVGGVEAITAGLRRHCTDTETQIKALAAVALEQVVEGSRDNQNLAKRGGVIDSMLFLIRSHPDEHAVQTKGIRALKSLIVNNPDNTKAVVAAGGIEEVVSALQHGTPRGQANYQSIAKDAGLVEAIAAALINPPKSTLTIAAKPIKGAASGNVSMLAMLLTTLTDLVRSHYDNQIDAVQAGAVEAIVATMRAQHSTEEMQALGAKALETMLTDNAAGQRTAKVSDATGALITARESHKSSINVGEIVNNALKALHSGENFPDRIMETDYGRRHTTSTTISDAALRGVTLEQILELQDFVQDTLRKNDIVIPQKGTSLRWEDLNMYQLCHHFILPLTKASECSFAELVAVGKQPPSWMVSHWWGTPLNYTVRMLQLQARSRHLHAANSVTYWVDVFANNRHMIPELHENEKDVMNFPFARAMLSPGCMGTVLLCDPDVTALLRTWCVFEAHVTQQMRCGAFAERCDKKRYFLDILAPVVEKEPTTNRRDKVTITMLQDAIGGSWNEVSDTEGVFFPLGVAHVGVGVDVLFSEASEDSDRRLILNFLTQGIASTDEPPQTHPKYDELNSFVHNVFASAELYRVASEQPDSCVEAAAALLELRADVNSFVRQGQTALFAAAGADPASQQALPAVNEAAQRDLLDLLLAARADVNHASADKKTVLDYAVSLSEDARGLLIKHGAKTFADAAPQIEWTANAQLAQILSHGFASEVQAFIGGDAGTKLGPIAQRSLQASASVLKLYLWAPCRIGMQTSLSRHQASLATERAQSVCLALESAGCTNTFHVHCGTQVCLLTLAVSLSPLRQAPPIPAGPGLCSPGRTRQRSISGVGLTVSRPRSPQAVLALRGHAPGRLPPVGTIPGVQEARGPVKLSLGLGSTWPTGGSPRECASPVHRRAPADASPSPSAGPRAIMLAPSDADANSGDGQATSGSRQESIERPMGVLPPAPPPPLGVMPHVVRGQASCGNPAAVQSMPWVPAPGAPARALHRTVSGFAAAAVGRGPVPSQGSDCTSLLRGSKPLGISSVGRPSTPGENGFSPGRVATDLDTLAGDRWFQTSITCSRSSPSLHTYKVEPVVSEVKGLGSTTPFAGMEGERHRTNGSIRVASSGRVTRSSQLSTVSPRPSGAFGNRPPRGGVMAQQQAQQQADAAAMVGAVAADGRPPTRGGQRPGAAAGQAPRASLLGREGAIETSCVTDVEIPAARHTLPALAMQSVCQRAGSRVFSISDLRD